MLRGHNVEMFYIEVEKVLDNSTVNYLDYSTVDYLDLSTVD